MKEMLLGCGGEAVVDDVFIREVPAEEFITGPELKSQLGFDFNASIQPWLLFQLRDGRTVYVSMKALRYGVSYAELESNNLIHGERTVTVNGQLFKVRLMTGSNEDPHVQGVTPTYNSEWDRLMYRIAFANNGRSDGKQATYRDHHLGVLSGSGGRRSWCQELGDREGYALSRGGSYLNSAPFTTSRSRSLTELGWRPVLELVE